MAGTGAGVGRAGFFGPRGRGVGRDSLARNLGLETFFWGGWNQFGGKGRKLLASPIGNGGERKESRNGGAEQSRCHEERKQKEASQLRDDHLENQAVYPIHVMVIVYPHGLEASRKHLRLCGLQY